jgi:L-asparaginase
MTVVAAIQKCRRLAFVASVAVVVSIPRIQAQPPLVLLIATGGTIASRIDPVTGAATPQLRGEELVSLIPELAQVAKIEVQNFSKDLLPSSYMGPPLWIELHKLVRDALARAEVAGVIISHGTDTLEETAYFLDLTVNSEKPIVLVGAQRTASDRDFDGPRNLYNAVRICVSTDARGKGVMIVLNNNINAAREATKTQTSDVETFKSGDYGFLGVADADRVIFYRSPSRRLYLPIRMEKLPYVEVIPAYAGVDGTLLRAAVQAGAKGLVIQALGIGNVNKPQFEAIQDAITKGIAVVISTRVPNGRVMPVYGYPGGGQKLKEAGAVFADNLSPQKARILLMLALQTTSDPGELQKLFDK